jgi:ABC-type multidrug transport system ATPase subunit
VIIIDHGRVAGAGTMQQMLVENNRAEIVVDQISPELETTLVEKGAQILREANRARIICDSVLKREVVEAMWANGCDVISLTPVKTSLEDTFLKLVGKGGGE